MRSIVRSSLVAVVVSLAASTASADDKAAATKLFKEGRALASAGNFAEACPKFEAAAQLSHTAGVRLNLADCYAKVGKTASAMARVKEALGIAEQAKDKKTIGIAHAQMTVLEPKLSYLTVVVSKDNAAPGLEVTLDGEKMAEGTLGTALPVDQGVHTVAASAPWHRSWSTQTNVSQDGQHATVTVVLPAELPPAPVAAATTPAPASVPAWATAAPPAPAPAEPAAQASWTHNPMRISAVVSAALGVVGLGVGTGFGIETFSKKSDYQQNQVGGRCINAACVSLSQDAVNDATASTVSFVVGGVLVATGAVLWLTSGHKTEDKAVAIVPLAGPQGMGAGVQGSF